MRSPIGPILVVFGLATVVVLVLLLFQNLGLRSDLEAARAEIAELRTSVAGMEDGVSDADLANRLDELETEIRDLLLTGGTDGGVTPGGDAALADRLDEILERIEALHDRVDEICDNVPVC
jgi:hypothetical protein